MKQSATTIGRILATSGLLLAVASCTPSIPQTPAPQSIVSAVFDPVGGDIPLPSNLLLQDPDSLPVSAAQKVLLKLFKANGGFPSDQEVAVTVTLTEEVINSDGSTTRVAPQIDPASFTSESAVVYRLKADGSPPDEVPLDPVRAGDLVAGPAAVGAGQVTVLSLHHRGRAPWEPGTYAALLRGGTSGVKAVGGAPVWASSVFFLVAQRQDMTRPDNLALLQAQTGSHDAALALANQLNALITAFGPAFDACDQRFPHQELAALALFSVGAKHTVVELDPGRGLVPLPIDLLRDPRPASTSCSDCGKLTALAACTLAAGTLDPVTGSCSSAAAAGFKALDGFSTTAPILAPTSDLVLAATVTPTTYRLYDLTDPASPVLVPPATYLTEPVEFTDSGVSPVVASQPVGATAADPTSPFRSRPLKENTSYAVVITTGVMDKTGTPLGRGTVGSILLFDDPLASATGASLLQGVDDASAYGLETMRLQLKPVLTALAAVSPPVVKADIAMAYTFKTQSILGVATQLAALPYSPAIPAFTALPGAVFTLLPADAFAKFGLDPAKVPSSNVQEFLETTITTFNLLDPATGAFFPDPSLAKAETIKVLIAVPKTAPACTGALLAAGIPSCAPMMVFRHGLGGGRADMLAVADSYAAKGMVTVAIDAAKHGDRSFCAKGDTTVTVGGATFPVCTDDAACVSPLPAGAQGDAKPPGTCAAGFVKRPVSLACMTDPACGWDGSDGIPLVSSSFLVTANFFRTRDSLRQDIIDQSQLIRAIAFAPNGAPHTVFDHMVSSGLVVDPATVYYSGQSLGAIQGAANVAANPRISKAVLNVGGGTLVDVFTTSPAFVDGINELLAGLGIVPGTSAYLQFLAVAKLILDPADPVNFAGHLTANTLPNLLPPLGGATDGSVPQAPKKILTQAAICDQTVPNTWNYVLDGNADTGPLPGFPGFATGPGTFQLYFKMVGAPPTLPEVSAAITTCAVPGATSPNAVEHGFFTDWNDGLMTATAQSDAASFVVSDTTPPSLVVLP